jgi:dipeptidase
MWYGLGDTNYTCYTPFYCCVDAVPEAFTTGSIEGFSWDSAWWVFNFVANFSYLRYAAMIEDIRAVQGEIESHHVALQPAVDQTAVALSESDPELLVRYLTDYCAVHAELVVSRYRELAEHLITRYNDGYVDRRAVGYPEAWLREVLARKPDAYRVPSGKEDAQGSSEAVQD